MIRDVSPDIGPTAGGALITITGSNFSPTGNDAVTIGGVNAPILAGSASANLIIVFEPAGQGANLPVQVTVNGEPSNIGTFSYGAPTITAITPNHGGTAGGDRITITGQNFSPTGNETVIVGTDYPFALPIVPGTATPTSVVVTDYPGDGVNLPVVLTVSGQASNTAFFSYDAPSITSITPNHGATDGGEQITIFGSNFSEDAMVTIGGVPATIVGSTDVFSYLIVAVPAGQGTGVPVVVRVLTQKSSPVPFSYDAPTISKLSTDHGATDGGDQITITGSNFSPTGDDTVTIGGAPAQIVPGSAKTTSLVVVTPPGQGTDLDVRVAVAGQTSERASFSYDAPAIAKVGPGHGSTRGGDQITITGANFSPTGDESVYIGDYPFALPIVPGTATTTSVVVTDYPGDGANLPVVITVAGQRSNSVNFSYDAPFIASVTPSHGPTDGGEQITITGTNFSQDAMVTIGGVPASIVSSSDIYSQLVVAVPAGAGANLPVVVRVLTQKSNAVTFSYDAPSLAMVGASSSVGQRLTFTGANFSTDLTDDTVTIGTWNAPVVSASATQLVVTAPAGYGRANVAVNVAGQLSNTLSFNFVPTVTSVTPSTIPTAGNADLTIMGTAFSPTPGDDTVMIGSTKAEIVSASQTQLVVTAPAGFGAGVNVRVTVGGVSSNALAVAYTAPAEIALSPSRGYLGGGTAITITGTDFAPDTSLDSVTIGGVPATIASASATQLVATTPAGTGTELPVVVTVAGQASAASVTFSYADHTSPGYYSSDGLVPGTPAPAGSYVSGFGATSPTLASPGYYVPVPGADHQTAATPGFFVPTYGATAPIPDPPGTTSGYAAAWYTPTHATSLAISTSSNAAVFGQAISFSAVVTALSPGDPTPTGTVQFSVDGAPLGGRVTVVNGTALSPPIATLAVGAHTVSATFSNSAGSYLESSATLSQVVLDTGVTALNGTLYVVGASSSNFVQISPVGQKSDGSTGLAVSASLGRTAISKTLAQTLSGIVIYGSNGNDTVQLDPSLTVAATIIEGNGNNYIQTGRGNDTVILGNGNDVVVLGAGSNTVVAGNGNDSVFADGGNNTIRLGDGNDFVLAGDGNNTVTVGDGNDTVLLANGDNVVVEGNGNDYVLAGNGANLVVGGLGRHTIMLGNGNNILIDGSAAVVNQGDSLRQILSDWKSSPKAAVSSRLKITYNTSHPNYLSTGSGRNWFFYTDSKTWSNRKPGDPLN
jgi:Ca2+-binding RTX toxin-like protein